MKGEIESGIESDIVGTVGMVAAVVAGGGEGGAVGLTLVGVFVSPSCIWASSFSGVLRPDVVGGAPGLMTGLWEQSRFPS